MARVTLELPERFGFSTEVQVYLSLVNYGGHLDNALLLTLVSEARVRFFQSLGYHESECARPVSGGGRYAGAVPVRSLPRRNTAH